MTNYQSQRGESVTYQAADTWDNEAGLADLDPQPATPNGIQTAGRVYAADGSSYPDGQMFVELVWSVMTNEQKNAIDTALGVNDTTTSNAVTLRLRGNDGDFANYNGTVHSPEIGRGGRRSLVGWQNVTYRVTGLEAL